VYKGYLRGETTVAIKVLRQINNEEDMMDEFLKEVEILRQLYSGKFQLTFLSAIRSKDIVQFHGVSLEPRLCMVT
jgi:hypothetical protein